MKNNKYSLLILFITAAFFSACERELDTEGISRITSFPTFQMQGEEVMTVVKGGTFTDPGVTTVEGYPVTSSIRGSAYVVKGKTQPSDVVYTSGAVDTNVPGMYVITYSSTNPDGFSGSTTRTVFVLHEQPNPAVDLTGAYASGTSPAATITKVADGVFYSSNAWGGGSTVVIPAYLICTDGVNVNVPQQESLVRIFGYGTVATDKTLNLFMSRPTFGPPPLIDLVKNWVKTS
jgi:hypothetical protein